MRQILCLLIVLILISPGKILSQGVKLQGKVIDAESRQPLAFVNVIIKGKRVGQLTDLDGKWRFTQLQPTDTLMFSYVGYTTKFIPVALLEKESPILIRLNVHDLELKEVVIKPGINPAIRIIQAVLDHKKQNNWERIPQFSYTSYNRFHFTAVKSDTTKRDSLNAKITDSIARAKGKDSILAQNDTLLRKLDSFTGQSHFFLTESVTKTIYMYPEKLKQFMIAEKVSGTTDPLLSLLAGEFNTFNIYADYIDTRTVKYLSPIAYGAISRYNYHIEDTLWSESGDTVFVISYAPKKDKLFNAFHGLLYISSNGYAIQNVIASPIDIKEGFSIKIQQQFEWVEGNHWFPTQVNADYSLSKIGGKRTLTGVGRSYFKDINFNPGLKTKDFNAVGLSIEPDAGKKDSAFWEANRHDSLSLKDKNTYKVIDSIGKKVHAERKIALFNAMMEGRLPVAMFDIDVNRLLAVDAYEGYRLGLGAYTNRKVSPYFNLGGYGAYGTRDKDYKYGGELNLTPFKGSFFQLTGWYSHDLTEFGGVAMELDRKKQDAEKFHWLNVTNMYGMNGYGSKIRWMMLRYLQVQLSYSQSRIQLTNNLLSAPYMYGNGSYGLNSTYSFAEARAGIRYAFREKYIDILGKKYSSGTKYPVVWLELTKGLKTAGTGDFDYTRLDAKLEDAYVIKLGGKGTIQFSAGKIWGSVPLFKDYNLQGNKAVEKFTSVYSPNTFLTMSPNEFAADQYASIFYTHSFENLLFKIGKIRPVLKLHQNIAVGSLSNRSGHLFFPFKTMEKGYYESGITLNNLLKDKYLYFGLGAFYRYGPYAFPKIKNNMALMLTMTSWLE